uniref:hypothetical protein n=1 Tax=Alistipes putredinis TaxID=28117 RepID=UPI003AB44F59
MATRINHKSDFTSYEQFTRYDKPVAVPERVRITYFTETGFPRCFVAERNGDILKNCSLSDDGMSLRVYVALSRQYIGTGPLKKIITETVEDANFPNGEKRLDSVAESNVVLWSGNSDNGLDTEDESELLPFRYGYSAYELAKIHGYEGTEEEYALAPLLAINELENYAKKDLSNVRLADFREKGVYPVESFVYSVDNDHSVSVGNKEAFAALLGSVSENLDSLLYAQSIASAAGDLGLSAAAVSLIGNDPLSYSVTFVGNDSYWHELRVDGSGAITRQYAYRLDDMATKDWLTSQGYKPTHVIDLGRYENGSFGIDDAWYWGDVQGAIYNYLDGKCNLLLKGASNYNEPRMYTIEGVERDGDTRFTIRFKTSATRVHVISI